MHSMNFLLVEAENLDSSKGTRRVFAVFYLASQGLEVFFNPLAKFLSAFQIHVTAEAQKLRFRASKTLCSV